jgi:hypothetical protein
VLVILLEGVGIVAAVAACGAFLMWGLRAFTPLGTRWQQTQNKRLIDQRAVLTCPIHGLQAPESLVRLPSGESLCSQCYQETIV